jgi:hypothetical protein
MAKLAINKWRINETYKQMPSEGTDETEYATTYSIRQTSFGFTVPVGSVVPIK